MSSKHTHPEMPEGMVFLCYADDNSYALIGWKNKDRGTTVPADLILRRNQKREKMFPVFVSRAEISASEDGPATLARLAA